METFTIGVCYGNCCSDTLNIGYCGQCSLLKYNYVSSYLVVQITLSQAYTTEQIKQFQQAYRHYFLQAEPS